MKHLVVYSTEPKRRTYEIARIHEDAIDIFNILKKSKKPLFYVAVVPLKVLEATGEGEHLLR